MITCDGMSFDANNCFLISKIELRQDKYSFEVYVGSHASWISQSISRKDEQEIANLHDNLTVAMAREKSQNVIEVTHEKILIKKG